MMVLSRYALSAWLLTEVANAVSYPVGVTNCGVSNWVQKKPQRAVTLNQGTTEVMLALGLENYTVGTAYIDDEIWPEYADAYAKIPVLSSGYPDAGTLFGVDPDFLYASYSSAFDGGRINYTDFISNTDECSLVVPHHTSGENRSYCREDIQNDIGLGNIQTYLQTPYCERVEDRPEKLTLDVLFDEIWDIATIFDVLDNGRTLIDNIQEDFSKATCVVETPPSSTNQLTVAEVLKGRPDPISVLWLDGWDEEEPFIGSCCGAPQLIMEYAGAENIFENHGIEHRRSWAHVPWDNVSAADPDLIVLIDAAWDPADEKLFHLCNNTKTRELRAVQNRKFLIVPFSASTLGVRIGALAYNLAEAMVSVARGQPLPTLQFSDVATTSKAGGGRGSKAKSNSGVEVYTHFPSYNASGTI